MEEGEEEEDAEGIDPSEWWRAAAGSGGFSVCFSLFVHFELEQAPSPFNPF